MEIYVKKLYDNVEIPTYATDGSAGLDIKAYLNEDITIKPNEIKLISTGLCMKIPINYYGQILPRSGLSLKGITINNSPGIIDSDYRNEIKLIVINNGQEDFIIKNGMRLAQFIIIKHKKIQFKQVENLDNTERTGGFGSTGI